MWSYFHISKSKSLSMKNVIGGTSTLNSDAFVIRSILGVWLFIAQVLVAGVVADISNYRSMRGVWVKDQPPFVLTA